MDFNPILYIIYLTFDKIIWTSTIYWGNLFVYHYTTRKFHYIHKQ